MNLGAEARDVRADHLVPQPPGAGYTVEFRPDYLHTRRYRARIWRTQRDNGRVFSELQSHYLFVQAVRSLRQRQRKGTVWGGTG